MAIRKHSTYVKHFAAMHLILSMQKSNGDVPNVAYVRDNAVAPKVADWGVADDAKYERFKYLQDMLPLVEPEIYAAFHKMLTQNPVVAGIGLSFNSLERHTQLHAATLQSVTDFSNVQMWSGPEPHGCYFIMREVVYELLG